MRTITLVVTEDRLLQVNTSLRIAQQLGQALTEIATLDPESEAGEIAACALQDANARLTEVQL